MELRAKGTYSHGLSANVYRRFHALIEYRRIDPRNLWHSKQLTCDTATNTKFDKEETMLNQSLSD